MICQYACRSVIKLLSIVKLTATKPEREKKFTMNIQPI